MRAALPPSTRTAIARALNLPDSATQEDIAHRLGISQTMVSKILRGEAGHMLLGRLFRNAGQPAIAEAIALQTTRRQRAIAAAVDAWHEATVRELEELFLEHELIDPDPRQ